MASQQICSYCQRIWLKDQEFCVGCGAPEPQAEEIERRYEFYRDGYFIKVIAKGVVDMEYFFFRSDKLVERFELDLRSYMTLLEAYGIKDGQDDWEIIWDIFKRAQEKKFGVVRTFENDPEVKRIEVRVVPWGVEFCNARTRSGDHLCRLHGGKTRSWVKAVGHV